MRDFSVRFCWFGCNSALKKARDEGKIANYGCIGQFPIDKPIPWTVMGVGGTTRDEVAPGVCQCNNWILNKFAETVIKAMLIIAQVHSRRRNPKYSDPLLIKEQISCYVIMLSLKFVLDIGADFIPGVGKAINAGLGEYRIP